MQPFLGSTQASLQSVKSIESTAVEKIQEQSQIFRDSFHVSLISFIFRIICILQKHKLIYMSL